MAMAEKKSLFVHGENGGQVVTTGNPITDLERAQDVARRYRCEFVDLADFQLHHELFKKFSPELMFRYNFVPLEETADGKLAIAIADPSQLMMIDEISLLLQKRIVTKVATLKQISRHPQEDGAVTAGSGRGQRRLPDYSRRREYRRRRDADHRQADGGGRYQPDYPAGGHYDFYRAATAGFRHSY